MDEKKLSQEAMNLLKETFRISENNFELIVHENNGSAKGYLGEIVFVSLKNLKTNEDFRLAIKQVLPAHTASTKTLMKHLCLNEINFYTNIWKKMEEFRKGFIEVKPFNIIPKYYPSNTAFGKDILILENLAPSGFKTLPKCATFDDEHIKLLLNVYGRLHGFSAAFREYNPQEYRKFTTGLENAIYSIYETTFFQDFAFEYMKQTSNMVENAEIKEKLKKYIGNTEQIAKDSIKYNGKNPVICHGDCWSDNMMFKYDNSGAPIDVRLVDFQIPLSGSVVLDLSYIFYSGGTKELFANLDQYLRVYYEIFSDTLRSFKLDPSKIFTFADLKREWKEHCKFGFVMGTMLYRNKLSNSSETIVEIIENRRFNKNDTNTIKEIMDIFKIDVDKLKELVVDTVQHLHENDYL